jgi:hypothetical protein
VSVTWTRSLDAIDQEIVTVEAKLQRVRDAAHPKHPVGHATLLRSLHERAAALYRERDTVVDCALPNRSR